jgi:hypothetical protein
LWICHRHARSKRQRAVCCGHFARRERLSARSPSSRDVVGSNHLLSSAIAGRLGVRKEPIEAPAMSRRGQCDQPSKSQSRNTQRTHRLFRLFGTPAPSSKIAAPLRLGQSSRARQCANHGLPPTEHRPVQTARTGFLAGRSAAPSGLGRVLLSLNPKRSNFCDTGRLRWQMRY